jgi:ent-kaurene oxidase
MCVCKFQKQFRGTRDTMIDNMLNTFHTMVADDPNSPLNFREVFKDQLFGLSVTQVSPHSKFRIQRFSS